MKHALDHRRLSRLPLRPLSLRRSLPSLLSLSLSLSLALSSAFSGCASTPGTGPQEPPAPPQTRADRWQAPLPAGGGETGADIDADIARWWQRFDDPLLPPLVRAAQAASPTLASAAARIERARATRVAAGAGLLPSVNAVGSANQGRRVLGVPVAGNASLGLQAAWEIDLFGGGAAGRDAAQARLEGAQAGWHDVQVSVAAEVATSYASLRACEAQRTQAEADAESRAQTARLTDLSARAGFTAPADAALARASAAQGRNQAVSQRAACETQLKSLVELTDTPEAELRQRLAGRTAQVPVPPTLAVPTLPAALLSRRPDLAEAARNVLAAAGDRVQAQAAERPCLSLSGALAAATLRSAGATTTGSTWAIGPLSVTFPLLDGGAAAAATSAARAEYDAAVAVYQGQVRRALREVEAALLALQSSSERQADASSAAQDFEASLRATEARQKGGLASLFDLEAARRSALAAQSALTDLQRERVAAWIALYRALGGGFDAAALNTAAAH